MFVYIVDECFCKKITLLYMNWIECIMYNVCTVYCILLQLHFCIVNQKYMFCVSVKVNSFYSTNKCNYMGFFFILHYYIAVLHNLSYRVDQSENFWTNYNWATNNSETIKPIKSIKVAGWNIFNNW